MGCRADAISRRQARLSSVEGTDGSVPDSAFAESYVTRTRVLGWGNVEGN